MYLQDNGSHGTVIKTESTADYGEPYWIEVQWDTESPNWYRMGAAGGMVDLSCVCLYCFCTGE